MLFKDTGKFWLGLLFCLAGCSFLEGLQQPEQPDGMAPPWPLNTEADVNIDAMSPSSQKEQNAKAVKEASREMHTGFSGHADYVLPNDQSFIQPGDEGRGIHPDNPFPLTSQNLGESFGQRLFASSNPPGHPSSQNIKNDEVSGKKTAALMEELEEVTASENQIKDWVVRSGSTLRETLDSWAVKEGWSLIWKTSREYPIQASVIFTGRFVEVASALLRSFT